MMVLASLLIVAACNVEVCPERENDCVWENDKFGMRAYGPGEYHKWSGFDVFNKGKDAGSVVWMMHHPKDCGNWHEVPWKGILDNYTMGPSRGVGGIAMFADGEWKTYPDWESFKAIHTGPDFCEFELVYPAFSAAGKMTCHITLKRGERFFRNDVSFERMPKDFVVGPGMDLEPKRGHKGDLVEEDGLVALFEDPKGTNGSTMSAVFTFPGEKVETLTDPNNCRVFGFRGKKSFTYWAGASWSAAGEITTSAAWQAEVRRFRAALADQVDANRRITEQFRATRSDKFEPLRPGAVKPAGWLRDWCVTAKDGYIGHLDEIDEHFRLAWTTNCMRRGKLLTWENAHQGSWSAEGGAYWFDGLVRLAWQLDDPELKAYAKKRLDTVLDRMNPNAITFVHWMDRRDPAQMKEISAYNEAWIGWAAAILGRAVAGYYQASGDPRALRALNWAFNDVRFFEYGNGKPVPSAAWETYRLGRDPAIGAALDAWCAKGPDFGHIVWRYAREPNEMEFRPFTGEQRNWRDQHGVIACETAISALRAASWRTGNPRWGESVLKWSDYIRTNCLQPYGVPVADESWGFTGPDRGTETCTVAADIRLNVEMLSRFGKGSYGDRVERALFNAGAACTTADFFKHVYVQTPNRTVVENRGDFTCPASARYYLKKNWPLCCTAALTRYLPDFVQHLWMKTSDGGLAATMYAPNVLATELDGTAVRITTETDYPFGETLKLKVEPMKPCAFPLKLRLPEWCEAASVVVNGEVVRTAAADGFVTLARTWQTGDAVTLSFPMKPFVTTGRDRNKGEPSVPWCAVSAGPLLFARDLPGADENTLKPGTKTDWCLEPLVVAREAMLVRRPLPKPWRWSPEAMPVTVSVPTGEGVLELVPYGSTCLRVSMFGVREVK